MGTTRQIWSYEINFVDRLTVNYWPTYTLTMRADNAKYGSILTGLDINQQSLGNYQYPKNITESNNVLSNHRFYITTKSNNHKNPGDHNKDREQKGRSEGRRIHELSIVCTIRRKSCCCGWVGHKSPSFCEKNKPKEEERAIIKAQHSHAQAMTSDTSIVTTSVSSNPVPSQASQQSNVNQVGWAGAHIELKFYQASEMRNWILSDNQSSVTVFCNPKMVKNIRVSTNGSMHLATNGGSIITYLKVALPQ